MCQYKVSVVVPVYNANNNGYLSRLIKCVLEQEYKNIELILVDNGSTDDSLQVCNHYAQKDNRVKVAIELKKGASAARNKGIDIASGDYIHLCDADDILDSDIYIKSMKFAQKYNADVIRFNMATYFNDYDCSEDIIHHPYEVCLDRKYIIEEIIPYAIGIKIDPSKKINGHCTLITKREIIEKNNIKYNENQSKEEDHPFLVNILAYSNSIVFLKETYYHYMKHKGSLISTFSPRFQNFCNNFNFYEKLFGSYYDFRSSEKIEYNVDCAIESMESIIYHYNDCNCKKEILNILKDKELQKWVSLLNPTDKVKCKLKQCIYLKKYSRFYYYFLFNYIAMRIKEKLCKLF